MFNTIKKALNSTFFQILIWVAIIAIIVSISLLFVSNTTKTYENENVSTAKQALVRAAVSCYSIEGFYPPSVDYLKENYGLSIDDKKYIIVYEVFSENVMPDMDILVVG